MTNETTPTENGAADVAMLAAIQNDTTESTSDIPASIDAATEPKPPSFDDLGLHQDVKQALDDMGYFAPTPVQTAVFTPVSAGKDLLVQSRTGTGKTAAFGLPIVNKMVPAHRQPQALILTPTRELALQVARELTMIGKHRGILVECVYGGAPIGKQIKALRDGVHIIVGTPGRVLDHIGRRTLDCKTIQTFVLDECDEMLSMGFLEDIERVTQHLPEKHQTLLFSATMPDEVTRYSRRHMTNPEQISLSRDSISVSEIHHAYYIVSGIARSRDLLKIIFAEEPESAIVFCNTRDETTMVAKFLQKQGLDAEPLSSDLSQSDRERVMGRTKAKNLRFLVATDVAARGIDISNLSHVINFSVPESPEVYVHRTGRTGRAGKRGTALSLVGPRELGNFRYVRLQFGIKPEERVLPKDDIFTGKLKVPLPPVGVPQPPDPVQILIRGVPGQPTDLERAIFEKLLQKSEGKRVLAALVAEKLNKLSTKTGSRPRRERSETDAPEGGEERGERPRFGDRDRGDRPRFGDRDRGERGGRDGERPRFRDRGEGGEARGAEGGERGERPRFGDRDRGEGRGEGGERGDRPRFRDRGEGGEARPGGEGGERPRFRDRGEGGEGRPGGEGGERPRFRDRGEGGEARAEGAGEARAEGGERPRFDRDRGERGDRPRFDRDRGEGRGDREARGEGGERGDRPRFDRDRGEGRGDRGGERGDRPRFDRDRGEGRGDREARGEGGERGERGDRPRFDRDRGDRRFGRDRDRDRGERGERGEGREDRSARRAEGTSEVTPVAEPSVEVRDEAPVGETVAAETGAAERTERDDRHRGRRDREGRRERRDTEESVAQDTTLDVVTEATDAAAPREPIEEDARSSVDRAKKKDKRTTEVTEATREFWETWAENKASRPETVDEVVEKKEDRKERGERSRGRGGRDKDKREGKSEKRSSRDREERSREDRDEPRTKRDTTADTSARSAAVADGNQARLFVSLGKKHGVSAEDLRALLAGPIGGDTSKIGSVSLRDSHAHVRVPEEHVEAIIAGVHGTLHNDHNVTVERARA